MAARPLSRLWKSCLRKVSHKQGEEEERNCCLRLNEAKNGKRMLEERNPALPLPNGEA